MVELEEWIGQLAGTSEDFIKEMDENQRDQYLKALGYLMGAFKVDESSFENPKDQEAATLMMERFFELGYYSGVNFALSYKNQKGDPFLDNI